MHIIYILSAISIYIYIFYYTMCCIFVYILMMMHKIMLCKTAYYLFVQFCLFEYILLRSNDLTTAWSEDMPSEKQRTASNLDNSHVMMVVELTSHRAKYEENQKYQPRLPLFPPKSRKPPGQFALVSREVGPHECTHCHPAGVRRRNTGVLRHGYS